MTLSRFLELVPSNNRIERIWKLAQVDFQSRYYNDRLGLLWALIKPIFEATLYFIAFKYLLEYDKNDFGLFLFGGIIAWMSFSEATSKGIPLLSVKSYLIENVQFNHIDLYFAHVGSIFMALFFNLSAFIAASLFMGQQLTIHYLLIPVLLITIFFLTMAFSFLLSTLQPFIKDITHLWDMTLLAGFWVSGIFFEPDIIFEKAPAFAYLNPFIGIIMNLRGIVLDSYEFSSYWMMVNLIYSIIVFIIGYLIFQRFKAIALEKL